LAEKTKALQATSAAMTKRIMAIPQRIRFAVADSI
jgi:hypothetical protein